jgi:Ni/Fe-hydrogenase subunit HybB-like protein
MSAHHSPRPLGGAILDRTMITLLALFGVAEGVITWRFVAGLGAVSNMNDGYAWGIWEPVNVVVFTGIGAGAYSVGLLCYLLNKGQYHPLVRPSVLVGAIAYTLGGASIVVALGRPWNMYWLAIPGMWNLSSVLLEVAVCVCAYVGVLWIEMLPALLEHQARSQHPRRSALARRWGARLARAMPYVIALAMLLPTMHQSSLGGLMLVAGPKLHPLWHTPLLPLLALVSCLCMGCGAVVVLTAVMRHGWNARHDQELLVDMSRVNGGLLVLFAALRMTDLLAAGKLPLFRQPDLHLLLFAVEMACFLAPAVVFLSGGVERGRARVAGALLTVLAGALWRVDTFLTCFNGGESWSYWPSWGEIAVTVGMASIGVALFIIVSRLLPVVEVQDTPAPVSALVRSGQAAEPASRVPERPERAG